MRPSSGLIKPGESQQVKIVMQPRTDDGKNVQCFPRFWASFSNKSGLKSCKNLHVVALLKICQVANDRFLVQAAPLPVEVDHKDAEGAKDFGNFCFLSVNQAKLGCFASSHRTCRHVLFCAICSQDRLGQGRQDLHIRAPIDRPHVRFSFSLHQQMFSLPIWLSILSKIGN